MKRKVNGLDSMVPQNYRGDTVFTKDPGYYLWTPHTMPWGITPKPGDIDGYD